MVPPLRLRRRRGAEEGYAIAFARCDGRGSPRFSWRSRPARRGSRPSADWRTIETAHFRIHFPSALRALGASRGGLDRGHLPKRGRCGGLYVSAPHRRGHLRSGGRPQRNGCSLSGPAGDRSLDVASRARDRAGGLLRLGGPADHARARAHRPPDAAAQSVLGDPVAALPAPVRTARPWLTALGHRRLRHAGGGGVDRFRTAGIGVPRDGAAAIRNRGQVARVRRAGLLGGMARGLDVLPGRIGLPRVACAARGERQPARSLEAHGVAAGRRIRGLVSRSLREVAPRALRPLPGGDHRARARRRRSV